MTKTRRQLLATGVAVGLGSIAGCSQSGSTEESGQQSIETVVSVPGDRVPENMAFDSDGNLLFGITAGELRRVSSDQLGETGLSLSDTEQVATLPGAIGVETAPDGTVYVAVANAGDQSGLWEVPVDGEATQLVSMEGFPNDILFDADRDRMLVTESTGGAVYAVGTDGSQSTWVDDDRLDTEGFGANGITRDADGTVYVAVTQAPNETGRLLEVPVSEDGSAGEPTLFLEGSEIYGADGITTRDGSVWVAANTSNRIVEVSSDGTPSTIATDSDGLVSPSDVVFGSDGSLYICNFASSSPEAGAILRTEV